MKQYSLANKSRCHEGLYQIFLKRIYELKDPNSEIIPFPKVFSSCCVKFSLKKEQAWEVLFLLHDIGFITIINGHGLKLNKPFWR